MSDPFSVQMLKAAVLTAKAGRCELLLARIFGKKLVCEEDGHVVTARRWRGKLYLTDYRCDPSKEKN